MIDYQRFELENGLRVIFHQDKSTPLATRRGADKDDAVAKA